MFLPTTNQQQQSANVRATAITARGVVETNSVQSQFAALTADRDACQASVEEAERERRLEQTNIQSLRSTQTSLTEHLRVAHATLGTETKKCDILKKEETSSTLRLQEERREISNLNEALRSIMDLERTRKRAFCKDMALLNDDLSATLRQQEEQSWQKLVSIETVPILMDALDNVNTNTTSAKTVPCQSEANPNSLVTADTTVATEDIESVRQAMKQAFESLTEASSNLRIEMENRASLEKEICGLREAAMQGRGAKEEGSVPLGEMELNELERLWDQSDELSVPMNQSHTGSLNDNVDRTVPAQSVHMSLFYGSHHGTADAHDNDHPHLAAAVSLATVAVDTTHTCTPTMLGK